MLAVNHELRAWALDTVPHSLGIHSHNRDEVAVIRFNKERDVVLISDVTDSLHVQDLDNLDDVEGQKVWGNAASNSLPEFHDHVISIALRDRDCQFSYRGVTKMEPWLQHFSTIQTVFITSIYTQEIENLPWCAAGNMNQYTVYHFDPFNGCPRHVAYWPDLVRHLDFAKASVPRPIADTAWVLPDLKRGDVDVDVWPMVLLEMW